MFDNDNLAWLNPKIRIDGDCWRWLGSISKDGYARITDKLKTGKTVKVTRYINTILEGPIPQGIVIRHKCRNKDCVNPKHLERGTPIQNVQDRCRDGTNSQGVRNARVKLTESQVLEIRDSQLSLKELQEKYQISIPQIHNIRRGNSWKHLGGTRTYHGPSQKLTDEQVLKIREDGRILRLIAQSYNISIGQVSRIKNQKQRKSI